MIKDLLREAPDGVRADVCIVGAGAAGIVLAVELVRMGKRVVLFEGGGAEIEESSQEPYRSELAGLPHQGIHHGRFRAKGGTTTKWGGQILELGAMDFEKRPWIPGSGWPFSKSVLTPFYERALTLEGLAGAIPSDSEVWRAIGKSLPSFDELEPYLSRWCPEPDFAKLHLKTLEEHEGLTVWLHANAVEAIFDGETARALRCRTLTGIEAVFSADQYVFCLGGIESSRFFLQPRDGGLPWNRSGLLGKHFQDHIDCNAASIETLDARRMHDLFDNIFTGGFTYQPKLRLDPGQQAKSGTLNVAGLLNFTSHATEMMGRLRTTGKNLVRGRSKEISGADLKFMVRHLPVFAKQVWRYSVERRAYHPLDAKILLRVHCEQEPESASSIALSEERDALGLLRTRLDWRISDLELHTIRQYVTLAERSLAGVGRVVPDKALMCGDSSFRACCEDSNHHMGGMRMADSPACGVVDRNLLLYGLRNVYVCSTAVFPTSGFSNPTHTLLALAIRLADHLG